MSNQLRVSAAIAVFCMALFALASTTLGVGEASAERQAGHVPMIGYEARN